MALERFSSFNVVIQGYDFMLERKEFTVHKRQIPCWSIFCVETGNFQYDIGTESGIVEKGQILITKPNTLLNRKIVEPLTMHQVNFLFECNEFFDLPQGKITIKNTERLTSTLFALRRTAYKPSPKIALYQGHLVSDLIFLYFLESDHAFKSTAVVSNDSITDMALMYMDNNIFDHAVIGNISAALHISPVQFTRRFRSIMGITPIEYLTNKRIDKVRQLLSTTKLTLQEIAEKCGYTNGFYLSRIFKQKTGLSPSEFRKMNNSNKK